ncbi:uncharacterized protein [Porites lutea]|uniref:uncharacterized protein isoform X2 n=1 Tax=Porites lutea TaxID=51062 RepID=UPI003CC69BD1
MKTWCLVTLSFVLFSALFFDTCSPAAFSEETASKLKRTYNEETKSFGKAALNDRGENDHWAREYDENDVDDHDWANDKDDSANKDDNNEDQGDMENEEGGKYEDEEQDTIGEDDECEDKEPSDLLEDDYDNDDDNDYYDDDDADDLSDKSDLVEWDVDNDEEVGTKIYRIQDRDRCSGRRRGWRGRQQGQRRVPRRHGPRGRPRPRAVVKARPPRPWRATSRRITARPPRPWRATSRRITVSTPSVTVPVSGGKGPTPGGNVLTPTEER